MGFGNTSRLLPSVQNFDIILKTVDYYSPDIGDTNFYYFLFFKADTTAIYFSLIFDGLQYLLTTRKLCYSKLEIHLFCLQRYK